MPGSSRSALIKYFVFKLQFPVTFVFIYIIISSCVTATNTKFAFHLILLGDVMLVQPIYLLKAYSAPYSYLEPRILKFTQVTVVAFIPFSRILAGFTETQFRIETTFRIEQQTLLWE